MPDESTPERDRATAEWQGALRAVSAGDLLRWKGLPVLTTAALREALGEPATLSSSHLGLSAAERWEYRPSNRGPACVVWVRQGRVAMIEVLTPPALASVEQLGSPDQVLPGEGSERGAHLTEQLYEARGMLITIADPFDDSQSKRVLRCRLITSQAPGALLGLDLYASRGSRLDFAPRADAT